MQILYTLRPVNLYKGNLQMKKLVLTTLIAAGLGMSQFTMAATVTETDQSGTITVNGSIYTSTCTINNGTKNIIVQLVPVQAKQFKNLGDTTGEQTFDIALTGCSGTPLNKANTRFVATSSSVDANGKLINQITDNSGAKNVAIELLDNGTPIDPNKPYGSQGTTAKTISDNAVTLTYTARYYALGSSVLPGKVQGQVTYQIAYE